MLKAIGQTYLAEPADTTLTLKDGRIATDADGRTSHPRVWAGGDCRHGGRDLTVEAVEHGKLAARSIHAALTAGVRSWLTSAATFLGIRSPNPFWLASAPPTDKEYNVERAFEAGWGGVVWKTLGEDGPPIVNVSGPRYGALLGPDRRVIGFNNIELITDRPLRTNLDEIRRVKRDWPDRALVVSLMVPCEERRGRRSSAWSRTPAPTASSSTSAARTA